MRTSSIQRVLAGVAALALALVGIPAAAQPRAGSTLAKTVEIEGTLRVFVVDSFEPSEHHEPEMTYVLDVGENGIPLDASQTDDLDGARDGALVSVEVAVGPGLTRALDRASVGARSVDGDRLADELAESSSRDAALTVVSAEFTATPAATPQTLDHQVYVVRLLDPAVGPEPTANEVKNVVSTSSTYWARESKGRVRSLSLRADKTLSYSNSCVDDPTMTLWNAAAALFPGVEFFDAPNHLLVVKPAACGGSTAGVGSLGSSVNSGGILWVRGADAHTVMHELGHNFSLDHANVHWEHAQEPLEYYGAYGAMGLGLANPNGGVFATGVLDVGAQAALGVLSDADYTRVSAGTHKVRPVTSTSGSRALSFRDPRTGRDIFVEYRDGKGFDAGTIYERFPALGYSVTLPTPPQSVLLVCLARYGDGSPECSALAHYAPGVRVYEVTEDRATNQFVQPRGLGFNASLGAGASVAGHGGGFTVSVDSLAADGAVVRVAIVKNSATVSARGSMNSAGAAVVDADVTSSLPATGTVDVLLNGTRLASGSLAGGTTRVNLGNTLSPGSHRLTVRYNGDGVTQSAQTTTTLTVPTPPTPEPSDPVDPNPGDPIPGDPIPGDPNPGDPNPGDPNPGDPNPGDPGDPNPGDPNPGDPAPGESAPDDTPGKATVSLEVSLGASVYRRSKPKATVTLRAEQQPEGKVRFDVDGKTIGTVDVSGGKASIRLPKSLALGRHTLQATYLGSAQHTETSTNRLFKVIKKPSKVRGFATGTKRVIAGTKYRDRVKLSHRGVLQRKSGKRWVTVRKLGAGTTKVTIKAGRRGTTAKYRIVIRSTAAVKGSKTKVLRLRAR